MIYYFIIINIIGFLCVQRDKSKAKHHAYRIPEKMFFIVSLIGGSLGVWIAMYIFHHKTNHLSFILGIPSILLVQIVLYVFINWNILSQ